MTSRARQLISWVLLVSVVFLLWRLFYNRSSDDVPGRLKPTLVKRTIESPADFQARQDQIAAKVNAELDRALDPAHRARWTLLPQVDDVKLRPDGSPVFITSEFGIDNKDYHRSLERG